MLKKIFEGMRSRTIFERLMLGYAAIMVLVISQGIYTTVKLNQIHRLIKTIDLMDGQAIRIAEHLSEDLFHQIAFEKKYLLSKDPDFAEQFNKSTNDFKKQMKALERISGSREQKELNFAARRLYDQYVELFNEEVERLKNDIAYSAGLYRSEKDAAVDRLLGELKRIVQHSRMSRDEKISASSLITYKVLNFTSIMAGLIILFGFLISFFSSRSINRPISILKKKTREIAEGNFEVSTVIESPPEIVELKNDFNMMCDQLKELEKMKIDFVSHVSHELRTPLTVIKEASSMLLEDTFDNNVEKEHELSVIINEECVRMISAVNRILDLSRMEARMMPFYFEECDLTALIHKTVSKIQPLLERKRIRLDLELPNDLPVVRIDEQQIEHVMENLLENALKYNSEKGTIVINATAVGNSKKFVEVSISDNGPGISEKDLWKIFEKFQRIENGKDSIRGTGLGLPIAKNIIASHGGKIWVESTEGLGSTFCFTVPVYSVS